jgi:hypothetical protein
MRRRFVPLASFLVAFAFICANASAAEWSDFNATGNGMCSFGYSNSEFDLTTYNACDHLQTVDDNSGVSLWQMSQALAATLAVGGTAPNGTNNPSSRDYTNAMISVLNDYAAYCQSSNCSYLSGLNPYTTSGDTAEKFYDDNAWIGQDLVQADNQWGGPKTNAEARAEDLYWFETTGAWNNNEDSCPPNIDCYTSGGVWYSTNRAAGDAGNNYDGPRNIQATGGAALLATEIYSLDTTELGALPWAEKQRDWTQNTLGRWGPSGNNLFLFAPQIDANGFITGGTGDNYGQSLYMAQDGLLYNLCEAGAPTEYTSCSSYRTNGQQMLQAELDLESTPNPQPGQCGEGNETCLAGYMETQLCPAWNAIFFSNAERLVKTFASDNTTEDDFYKLWDDYNTWVRGNIDANGGWNTPKGVNWSSCAAPLPLAGAVRSLIAQQIAQPTQ